MRKQSDKNDSERAESSESSELDLPPVQRRESHRHPIYGNGLTPMEAAQPPGTVQTSGVVQTPGTVQTAGAIDTADSAETEQGPKFSTAGFHIQRALRKTATTTDEIPTQVLSVLGDGGERLDAELRDALEDRMGTDFSNVNIHTGGKAAKAADAIDARAFTCGNDIVFNAGEYDPESPEGQHLLAHELAHVRQQTGAAISMMPKADADLEIDPDPQLEREADQVAEAALSDGPMIINRMGADVHIQRSSLADHIPAAGGRERYNGLTPEQTRATETTDAAGSEFAELDDGNLNETIASLVENQREIIGQLETSEQSRSMLDQLGKATGKGAIGAAGGLVGAAAGTLLAPGLGTAGGAVAGQQIASNIASGIASDVSKTAFEPVYETGSKAIAEQSSAFGDYIENLIDEKIKQRFGGADYDNHDPLSDKK